MLDEEVDFVRGEFAGEFRHVTFAIGDDVAQSIRRHGGNLVGLERGSAEMTAFGGFAVAFGAILGVDGVRGQGWARDLGGGGDDHDGERAESDGEMRRLHEWPQ